jgi:neutral ceramidase
MGTLLGEEALATARDVTVRRHRCTSRGQQTLQCPGKITTPQNLARECSNAPGATVPACNFKDADGPPVSLNYGLLKLGDVAIVHADANVVPSIGDKLKRALPLAHTMVVLDNFGPFRFLVEDASYPLEHLRSHGDPREAGLRGAGLIDGVLQLMEGLREANGEPG